jgi:suppressor for copper-sensitivity B
MSIMPAAGFWPAALIVLCTFTQVFAQQSKLRDIVTGRPLVPQASAEADTPESIISVEAKFTPPTDGRPAMLAVTAHVQPGWHVYSLTQKPVQALPTTIAVDESPDYRLVGGFRPDLPASVHSRDGVTFEEHEGTVTWQAPLEIRDGVDLADLKIDGKIRIQTCQDNRCLPPHTFEFTAALAAPPEARTAAATGSFSAPNIHATLYGHVEPKVVAPGGQVKLVIEAEPADDWHVYALEDRDTGALGYKPTLIVLTNTSGFKFSRFTPSAKPIEAPSDIPNAPPQRYHEARVAWTTTLTIPKNAKPGAYTLAGLVGYQACFSGGCDLPHGARFEGTVTVGDREEKGPLSLAFSEAKYGEAAKAAAELKPRAEEAQSAVESPTTTDYGSLPMILGAALIGGFILNFMPCVLPVIGLKILSFAEQAGHSRAHVFALNLWYSLGVLTVFGVLAALASVINLGWGQQFGSTPFNIVMIAIVFVMALSFLDVWEIPIPGFVGSGAAANAAAREGAAGAYFKGVLATVLATPCSGPFLGPVLGYTLNQPPHITFLIFGCVGVGMAAPYLVIGAFPKLMSFLPKPGAWMDTFKQLMGFVLLGTVVYLFTILDRDYFVPTFALLVGLWAACWWIGRVSLVEPLGVKLRAWATGAAIAAAVGFVGFHWLTPRESLIPWRSFSRGELARLTEQGNTVLVDFTANWCPTCKWNLHYAIETPEVRKAIDSNQVVPLLADWTDGSAEIQDALATLQSKTIPVLAVYPAGKPEPIILRDVISEQQVLEAIKQAGPSKGDKALAISTP